jgi:hypothetical protein
MQTPEEYIASLEEPRRSDIAAIDKLIREVAPQLKPGVHSDMLIYGPYHYKYASGREGDSCHIGLASRKTAISLYCNAVEENGYVAEGFKERLPKAKVGCACVGFKRLADVDEGALRDLIAKTASCSPAGA